MMELVGVTILHQIASSALVCSTRAKPTPAQEVSCLRRLRPLRLLRHRHHHPHRPRPRPLSAMGAASGRALQTVESVVKMDLVGATKRAPIARPAAVTLTPLVWPLPVEWSQLVP